MISKKVYIFLLILLAVPLVSADVIFVNSGGADNIIITSNPYIEGFFFADFPSGVTPGGGGGWYTNDTNVTITNKTGLIDQSFFGKFGDLSEGSKRLIVILGSAVVIIAAMGMLLFIIIFATKRKGEDITLKKGGPDIVLK